MYVYVALHVAVLQELSMSTNSGELQPAAPSFVPTDTAAGNTLMGQRVQECVISSGVCQGDLHVAAIYCQLVATTCSIQWECCLHELLVDMNI